MTKPKIFVNYSHKDSQVLEQLQPFLKPLERDGLIEVFIDKGIKAGEDWNKKSSKHSIPLRLLYYLLLSIFSPLISYIERNYRAF